VLFNRSLPLRGLWAHIMIRRSSRRRSRYAYLLLPIFYEAGGPLVFFSAFLFLSNPHWAIFPSHSSISGSGRRSASSCCWPPLQGRARRSGRERDSWTRSRAGRSSWHVSLPHLQPTIVIVLLLPFRRIAQSCSISRSRLPAAAQASPPSPIRSGVPTGLRYFDIGYASAMAYGLLIFVMIIITMFFRRVRNTYA